ncbi:phage tail family protein [Clostridioides mangenotii]|uniref:distal tail protein Dit n=1 Tax=Metaclostridioides mangenotii TaxID=1540 RepID=UPI00214A42D4|nr:distal tail protein Dit [Clostridioides mangenotii]MCR1955387.1 phage tail family protein [Clostridioides mangenotii]
MLHLIIDGKSTKEYSLSVYERPNIPTPKMRIEEIEVDGRDGSLTRKKGYSNIEIEVELNILEDILKPRLRQIKAWLLNAKRICFSDDYDYFYKVKNAEIDNIENEIDCYGKFTVKFNCDPFIYSNNGGVFNALYGNKILNLGTYKSRPYFKLTGKGDIYFTLNNKRVDIKGVSDYVEIDSETFTCTRGSLNMLSKMTGDFPILNTGENNITLGNCTLEYKTRERFL